MTIARLTMMVEGITGTAPTAEEAVRIAENIFPLTEAPDSTLTNNQKATVVCKYVRENFRSWVMAGAEANEAGKTPARIRAAVVAALKDIK